VAVVTYTGVVMLLSARIADAQPEPEFQPLQS